MDMFDWYNWFNNLVGSMRVFCEEEIGLVLMIDQILCEEFWIWNVNVLLITPPAW